MLGADFFHAVHSQTTGNFELVVYVTQQEFIGRQGLSAKTLAFCLF
jgi:hypothetical protein